MGNSNAIAVHRFFFLSSHSYDKPVNGEHLFRASLLYQPLWLLNRHQVDLKGSINSVLGG